MSNTQRAGVERDARGVPGRGAFELVGRILSSIDYHGFGHSQLRWVYADECKCNLAQRWTVPILTSE